MACIQPDGTLAPSGETILLALQAPKTMGKLAQETDLDLFMVRAAMREFLQAEYVEQEEFTYRLTPQGLAALEGSGKENL
ncbi:MAG: hypothetical protein FJ126_07700 [Deltaproteobacteria bacterium]|nr:hypothetical protein [Deltaproteobacteria bacterium]